MPIRLAISSLVLVTLLAGLPVLAVDRTVLIKSPAVAKPGAEISIVITASTEATDDEQIGFFHAEYSIDGGQNWHPVYTENAGRSISRTVYFKVGPAGSKSRVRLRVAFRGGQAGDVDFAGAPIEWSGSWGEWLTPPAKNALIEVIAR